jgi:hypothetical protein
MLETNTQGDSKVVHSKFREPRRPNTRPIAPKVNLRRVVGLAPMSRVTTNFGEVYAHVLRQGDCVRTVSGQFQRIVQVDRLRLDEEFLRRYPEAQPICIRKGAFGPNLPKEDLIVAPFQKLRVGPAKSDAPVVFAQQLLGRPFVHRVQESQITYTNVILDGESQILCEGVAVDTDL